MIRYNNDYSYGAHPRILSALTSINENSYGGYGLDPWCDMAADTIRTHCDRSDAEVHFIVGGTQANFTVIDAALRPHQAVVCADSGHINVHETGAVEHTGHKILGLASPDGKITADQIASVGEDYRTSPVWEHVVQPKMVYLSFPTEFGTVYTLDELTAIRSVCDEYMMYLYIDGARMSYGLASSETDVTLPDIARLADAFYIGGTKCGALFGEAIVLCHDDLKPYFRAAIKQNAGLLAKGWLMGIQFETLFRKGLYFELGERAVRYAMRIRKAFENAGIPAYIESSTNQQFVVVSDEVADKLAKDFVYEDEGRADEGHRIIRFCTSWATTEEDVEVLVRAIRSL
jgi:threonine aldolase